jgi:hypothetical protein
LVSRCIQKDFTEPWLPACRRQSPDGLGCGRSAVAAAGDSDPASNSVQLVVAPVTERGLPDRRRLPGKQRVTSNGLPSFQNVIAGAHRLVRQRLGSDDVVGPGLLAFVERLASGQKRLAKFAASMHSTGSRVARPRSPLCANRSRSRCSPSFLFEHGPVPLREPPVDQTARGSVDTAVGC